VHNERQRLGRPTHLGWMLRWLVNRRRLAVPLAISLGCHLTGAWLVRIEPPLVFTRRPPQSASGTCRRIASWRPARSMVRC